MIDKQVLRDYLTKLSGKQEIADDVPLLASRVLDSLMMAEWVVFLEDHYNFSFDDDDLTPENLGTINGVVAFLENKGVNQSVEGKVNESTNPA